MSEFESVAIIPGSDENDEVWATVKRTINGSTVRYIERFKARDFTDLENAYFVDCGETYDSTSTSTMTGLDHLEAETVNILGDGVKQPQKVVSGGEAALSESASVIQAGLPITYRLQPMKINLADLAFIPQKIITGLIISLYRSLGGQVGPDSSNLDDIQYTADTWDTGPDLHTGTMPVPFTGKYERAGDILIYDDGPLPMTVRAIGVKLRAEID